MLRNRYKNFLPDAYYPDDIIAYSTGKERTHATAALVLAGLYPPTAEEKWSDELSWHPIPIYGDIIFNVILLFYYLHVLLRSRLDCSQSQCVTNYSSKVLR